MRVFKIDGYEKLIIPYGVTEPISFDQLCRHASPDKQTKNCRDWQGAAVKKLQQIVVKRSSASAAIMAMIDENPPKDAPMWLFKGVQRPMFGIGLILGYSGSYDQFFPCPYREAELQELVTFL